MSIRLPLYAKILFWFFLNLVLLAAAFFLLIRGQFRFGLDWMLAAADPRIQAVSDVIVADLNDRTLTNWNAVLKRFDDAYRIQFLVFRSDGTQLAGAPVALPPEVRARLGEGRGPMLARSLQEEPGAEPRPPEGQNRSRFQRERSGLGPPPGRGPRPDFLSGPFAQPRGPYPKTVVRTLDPTRYWLIVRAPINDPHRAWVSSCAST